MSLTSFHYLCFLPVVFIFYYLLPHRFRWFLLLVSSMLFYMIFSWQYLLMFSGVILVNHYISGKIFSAAGHFRRNIYLSGILFNILILCFFKYFNYLNIDFRRIAAFLDLHYPDRVIAIILPLGMSYLIFTAISYLIDIKRREIEPENHVGILATYFLFFPKVIQGPIERAGMVLPQFHAEHAFDYRNITYGLKLLAWGFFKKLVIADTLAVFVNAVYSNPQGIKGPVLILGVVCFAFQLYADFSGYTDIALGSARILGFELTQNFRQPYLARSVRDFWTRWHISLSSWCSDYIFIPIVAHVYDVKRRLKKSRFFYRLSAEKILYVTGTLTTFMIIGIWHGVGWTFIMVGLLFGFYVSFDMLTKSFRGKINHKTGLAKFPSLFNTIQILTTFLLVCIVWIFFRANNLQDAFIMVAGLFHGWSMNDLTDAWTFLSGKGINERMIGIMVVSTGLLIATDVLSEKKDIFQRIKEKPAYLRWSIYYLLLIAIIVYGSFQTKQFIYAQF